ncbi:MAG TPA: nitroreductase family protein [Clostridia bacterium]|nr:nitroreductase family protein [Clostridia bacterium]
MNETLNSLKTRRSIRSYLPKQVEKDLLDQVLEAGTFAPTGGGQQVPVIVAVQDPNTVKQLSRMNAKVIGNDSDPFYGAPSVLVVLAERTRRTYLLDGASVMTTLVNAAHAVGLGSCWIHRAKEMFESEEGKALLAKWGLSGDYEGIGNVIVGYPAGPAPQPAPRKANYIIRV